MGELVRLAVEFVIGERPVAEHDGRGVRRSPDLGLEQFVDAAVVVEFPGGGVPLFELGLVPHRQGWQFDQGAAGTVRQGGQQPRQQFQTALHRGVRAARPVIGELEQ
jgi:hypothetical protein